MLTALELEEITRFKQDLSRAEGIDEVLKVLECKTYSEDEIFKKIGLRKPSKQVNDYLIDEGIEKTHSLYLFETKNCPVVYSVGIGVPQENNDYRLCLFKKGLEKCLEIAVLGFDINKGVFSVKQIQGAAQNYWVQRKKAFVQAPYNVIEALPKDWPGILVRSSKRLAKDIGCHTITITRAQNHHYYVWPVDVRGDLQEHRERMKERYNRTARRNGFDKKEKLYLCKL